MTKSIIVVDDFYADPYSVRDLALNSDFEVKGNFPGQRTRPFSHDGIRDGIARAVGDSIALWPEDNYNGAFQFSVANDQTWVHADHTTIWSGVVFLTPSAPPESGTAFFSPYVERVGRISCQTRGNAHSVIIARQIGLIGPARRRLPIISIDLCSSVGTGFTLANTTSAPSAAMLDCFKRFFSTQQRRLSSNLDHMEEGIMAKRTSLNQEDASMSPLTHLALEVRNRIPMGLSVL